MIKDTSLEAYESMQPYIPVIKDRILNYIVEQGLYGSTRDQIEVNLGFKVSTINPRIRELLDEGKVIETEETRPTTSGRKARVIVASEVVNAVAA